MNKYLEDNLHTHLRDILPIIQKEIMNSSTYFGIPTQKNPIDAWIYQEIIFDMKPDIIIEIGNLNGGSTLMLAHLCDLIGKGKIIGVDITHYTIPKKIRLHPRISFITGDACQSFEKVKRLISPTDRILIIEDSSHTYSNTLNVLNVYSTLLKNGDYFIVEDSICHHGLSVGPHPGPYEAINEFITNNKRFQIDRTKERFLITWNPKGYIKCVLDQNKRKKYTLINYSVNNEKIINTIELFIPPIVIQLIKRFQYTKYLSKLHLSR